jgi:hypothetical protein
MAKNFDLDNIAKRNKTLKDKKKEIFEDFKFELLSYREIAKKYELKLYDVVKFLNQDEFKDEVKQINDAKAINYIDQINDEIDKIKDDSSNATVAKQRMKAETFKWLAKCTAPRLFNESFQVALVNKEIEQNKEPIEFNITLNNK